MTRAAEMVDTTPDVYTGTSRVLSRRTAYDAAVTRAVQEACATACRSCGDECSTHGGAGMEHCRVCAEACRRCERACRALLDAASRVAPVGVSGAGGSSGP